MTAEPGQNKIDRAKALANRNKKDKVYYKDKAKQAQRDQLVITHHVNCQGFIAVRNGRFGPNRR
ncbi:hypothetical protein BLX87_00180 [Bacillus sp. VT-16-64]|nr:hypothetical protein BLX87_00180 [Bacillus sp. VT-16-64]